LAPEGTLYVTKPFSITNDAGIIGFKIGDQVKVLDRKSNLLSISAKNLTFNKEEGFFTNNIDQIENLLKEAPPIYTPIPTPIKVPQISPTPNPKVKILKDNLNRYKIEIDEIKNRIDKASKERSLKGFPAYGGSRPPGGIKTIVTLSVDASQIEKLIEQKNIWLNEMRSHYFELQKIDYNSAAPYSSYCRY